MNKQPSKGDVLDWSFNNPTCGSLSGMNLVEELRDYILDQPQHEYLVTVGSDSRHVHDRLSFVSVIAVQRIGHGGRFFWRRAYRSKFNALRRRIYFEATRSLNLASILSEILRSSLDDNSKSIDYDLEIHVDIGQHGPTADMINEIVGMIRGSGYQVKTKPEAYCAAVVADRYA